MSNLLIGFLGALVATNQPAALSNLVAQKTGIVVKVPDADDPVAQELRKIMEDDDAAHDEVDRWILEESKFAQKGAGNAAALNARILKRFEQVQKSYEAFLTKHPTNVHARLAFGSFLEGIGEEHDAFLQWEKAKELDPKNPAAWNNLANYHGHRGPAKKAFEYYAKAIELNPHEPVYYHNFGTTVFLFRKDAREYYNIEEQQVFDKALELYEKARVLKPNDFILATDIARTYYGIRPTRVDEALKAWTNALNLARDEMERQGVYVHLARFEMQGGRFDKAREQLAKVTMSEYDDLKKRVGDTIDRKEKEAKEGKPPADE
ncbi:MAG: hypothetical protein AB1705_12700 [Verrucomicrobiota bacterium]